MQVKDIMSKKVDYINCEECVAKAAEIMEKDDVGFLPIECKDKLVGMLTDRDIAIRAVAKGLDVNKCKIADVMTKEVLYCKEDDDVEDLAENMAVNKVRRMPVLNKDKKLVGVVSLGDISFKDDAELAGEALRKIAIH